MALFPSGTQREPISLVLILGFLFGVQATLCSSFAQDEKASPTMDEIVDLYIELRDNGQHQDAVIRLDEFAQDLVRPATDRAKLFAWKAMACTSLEQDTCFKEAIETAIKTDAATGHYWQAYFWDEVEDRMTPTESFRWLLANASHQAQAFDVRSVRVFFNELVNAGRSTDARAMLEQLANEGYSGNYDGVTPESLWVELARLQLADGDIDRATRLLKANLNSSSLTIRVWQDRDFALAWDALDKSGVFHSDQFLLREQDSALSEADTARGKGWEAWIGHRLDLVMTLRIREDYAAAEELALETLFVVPDHLHTEPSYNWITNELAYIYEDQQRVEEALTVMADLLSVKGEKKGNLIGHLINQSVMQWRNGQPAAALASATEAIEEHADYASEYGMAWAEASRLCTLTAMGRLVEANDRWQALQQTPDVNYAATTMMALCLDDLDFAARVYIERLSDVTERASALAALSQHKWVGAKNGEYRLRERLALVARRQDVQAAIDRVGRLGNWPFPRGYWGQF